MEVNFKDLLNNKAEFVHKPNLVFEYRNMEGVSFYSLDSDLIYWTGKEQIVVKALEHSEIFITNLASVPEWLHWLIRPDNKYLKYPSVLHDYIYDNKSLAKRVYADWIFLQALKAEGCPFFLRWSAFLAVRRFGGKFR